MEKPVRSKAEYFLQTICNRSDGIRDNNSVNYILSAGYFTISFFTTFLLILISFSACKESNSLIPVENPDEAKVTTTTDSIIYYKPSVTDNIEIQVHIPKGLSIDYVMVDKSFISHDDIHIASAPLWKIIVEGANKSGNIDTSAVFTFNDLVEDLDFYDFRLLHDDSWLRFGDYWIISFVSILSDGKYVKSDASVTIKVNSIPNEAAWKYKDHIIIHDPSGGTYPDNAAYNAVVYKYVMPFEDRIFWCDFANKVNSWKLVIGIMTDNSIALDVTDIDTELNINLNEGDPFDSTLVSHYEPITGIFYLYYNYTVSGDRYIVWETLTPVSNL